MIRRLVALLAVAWALGFLWFAIALPRPVGAETTDAVIVPTGGAGRIERGLQIVRDGNAEALLVTD